MSIPVYYRRSSLRYPWFDFHSLEKWLCPYWAAQTKAIFVVFIQVVPNTVFLHHNHESLGTLANSAKFWQIIQKWQKRMFLRKNVQLSNNLKLIQFKDVIIYFSISLINEDFSTSICSFIWLMTLIFQSDSISYRVYYYQREESVSNLIPTEILAKWGKLEMLHHFEKQVEGRGHDSLIKSIGCLCL